jgi:hypothetical protein
MPICCTLIWANEEKLQNLVESTEAIVKRFTSLEGNARAARTTVNARGDQLGNGCKKTDDDGDKDS